MNIIKYLASSGNPVIDGANKVTDASGLDTDIFSPAQALASVFIGLIGLVAVIMVIIGAVQLSTSQGDSGRLKKAKDTIMYGLIGLVIAILAFAIVNFVLSAIL